MLESQLYRRESIAPTHSQPYNWFAYLFTALIDELSIFASNLRIIEGRRGSVRGNCIKNNYIYSFRLRSVCRIHKELNSIL